MRRVGSGAQLPAETELMKRYEASRPTLRFALAQIENEGLLVRRQGLGNFVRHAPRLITYGAESGRPACRADAAVEADANAALRITVSRQNVRADDELAALLELPTGSDLTEYFYKSRYAIDPCNVAWIYVPHAVAVLDVPVTSSSPTGEDVQQALTAADITIAETRTSIVSRLPNAEESRTLRIGAGTAVLGIEQIATDTTGRAVSLTRAVFPGYSAQAVFIEQVRELEATR
ncbi:GntR family transcriptional regulator [Streptomyces polyrhachis]|uniref:GntR family transcriptional regulator n=1 Tax=Streptomyces polyrhachis TaxID=1282885 RepID=A0ABW2GKS4_9ACTN